jgi:hypothetical protein
VAVIGGVGAAADAATAPSAAPRAVSAALPMKNCGYNCEHSSWVCRYDTEPGEPERLLLTDNPALLRNVYLVDYLGDDIAVGQQYWVGTVRSVVIIANLDDYAIGPAPTLADCPPPTPPPSPTSTSATTTTATTSTSTATSTTATTPTTATASAVPVPPAPSTSSTAAPSRYPLLPVKAGVVTTIDR